MDISKMCPGCMQKVEHRDSMGICPHCGYDLNQMKAEPHQMQPFTILAGKYLVGKVIGEGGFGISYLGFDLNLELVVAIKEFYPNGFVTRESNVTTMVSMYAGKNEADVSKWREGFINEARNLAKFSNLNGIVEVRDFFNENGTAYIVMEYIEGITLKQYLKQNGGKISVSKTFEMMEPVIRALSKVHDAGIIHRDISPDNIMITKYGGMKLLDFGAAREFAGNAEKSLSIMLKPGYAPEEQYRSRGKQGPWSDVYALTATIYKCITGVTPVESMERMREDTLKSPRELGVSISDAQNTAVMQGMAVYAENRFQSMNALYMALYSNGSVMKVVESSGIKTASEQIRSDVVKEEDRDKKFADIKLLITGIMDQKVILIGAVVVCGVLLIILCAALMPKEPDSGYRAGAEPDADQSVAESVYSDEPGDFIDFMTTAEEHSEDAADEMADVEDSVLRIRDKYDRIVNGISSNSYDIVMIDEGTLAYSEQDQIKAIVVQKDYGGSDYTRYFYYDESGLFFAYYEGVDSHRLYFDADQLLRWRYSPDAADHSKATDYDLEDTYEYYQWETLVLSESQYMLDEWKYVSANGIDIQDYILVGSDVRYISKSELRGFTTEQCRLARNEIYEWYVPSIAPDDFDESLLNSYEIANRDLIVEYEKECGYR